MREGWSQESSWLQCLNPSRIRFNQVHDGWTCGWQNINQSHPGESARLIGVCKCRGYNLV